MSRLDREITAAFEEAGAYAKPLMIEMAKWIENDEDLAQKTAEYIKEHEPKQFDDYIRDIKRAFLEDGWTPPHPKKDKEI